MSPAALESLLTAVFATAYGKNPVVQKWRKNETLFSDQAASFLAGEICTDQKTVDEVLKSYYVGPLTRLGVCVRAIAARCRWRASPPHGRQSR